MRASDGAWLALGVGVMAYEVLCPKGETMSEGVDRYIEKHPVVTCAVIGTVALHLANVLPPQLDIIHQLGRLK